MVTHAGGVDQPQTSATSSSSQSQSMNIDETVGNPAGPVAKKKRLSLFSYHNSHSNTLSAPAASVASISATFSTTSRSSVLTYIDFVENQRSNVICSLSDVITQNNNQFATLTKLFEYIFSTPATSAPVERVFSHGGIFMRPHRARLGDKLLSELVFCRCNEHMN